MQQVISITTCDTFTKINFVWEAFHIIHCFVQQISQGESFSGYSPEPSTSSAQRRRVQAGGQVSGSLNPLPLH